MNIIRRIFGGQSPAVQRKTGTLQEVADDIAAQASDILGFTITAELDPKWPTYNFMVEGEIAYGLNRQWLYNRDLSQRVAVCRVVSGVWEWNATRDAKAFNERVSQS